jgi:segregation and condensation protein B
VGEITDLKELSGEADFFFDEIDELDKLSEKIKAISTDTPFTKILRKEEKNALEQEKGRSAFDILEEHVRAEEIIKANQEAALSQLINEFEISPRVVRHLNEGPFNLPQEEDDFEMIDLDTNTPIKDS